MADPSRGHDCQFFRDRNIKGDFGVRVASLETLSWHRTQAFSSQGWELLSSSSAQALAPEMMATSALKDPVGYQKHTSDELPPIHPGASHNRAIRTADRRCDRRANTASKAQILLGWTI